MLSGEGGDSAKSQSNTQHYFHYILLVSLNDVAAQIQGVEKQIPLDEKSCKITLQSCLHIGMGIIVNN